MKRLVFSLSLIVIFSTSVYAGFWSSVAGGVVANSLTQSRQHSGYAEDAQSDEKRIQQSLTKLGYYSSVLDGNLNSFETREAIERFQEHYFIDKKGVLAEQEKQDLLYIHDLFKNYKQEYKNPEKKDSQKLIKLYQAFDKIEDKVRNNNASFIQKMKFKLNKPTYLSTKLKQDIILRRDDIKKAKEAKRLKILAEKKAKELVLSKGKEWKAKSKLSKFGIFSDYDSKLLWQDKGIRTTTWEYAHTICKNLALGEIYNWRIPTKSELNTLYKIEVLLNYKSQWSDRYSYWSSDDDVSDAWVIDFNNGKNKLVNKGYNGYAIRCVKSMNN